MTYTSIFEKILILFKMISTSWIYIIFTLVAILLITLLALKKISKKNCFILLTIATELILISTICLNYNSMSKLANSIIDNIFTTIYFPSAYAYLFILIIINTVTITSLLNKKSPKTYKTLNGIIFLITNFVLTLILKVIATENIDIFKKESLFTNTNIINLLEFSINIFIIWLIALTAIYLINIITERIIISRENKKLITNPAITISNEINISDQDLEKEYLDTNSTLKQPVQAIIPKENQYKFLPNFTVNTKEIEEVSNQFIPSFTSKKETYSYNFQDNNTFDLSAFIPKKQEVKPINIIDNTSKNTNKVFEQILNNKLPLLEEKETTVEEVKNTYTLNDYRIFNKMLKDIREHNQSNSITIDKNLEYRLITKYSTETYNMFKTMLKIYSN